MNHKLSGLEQVCLLAVLSIRSPACISRSQEQGWFLSGGSRRESLFLPRSPSRGCPQPLLPSFQPSRALLIIVLPSRHFSFSWSPLPLPFSLDIWIPSVVRLCHSVPNYVRSGVSAFQLEHYEWGNSDKDEEREREGWKVWSQESEAETGVSNVKRTEDATPRSVSCGSELFILVKTVLVQERRFKCF